MLLSCRHRGRDPQVPPILPTTKRVTVFDDPRRHLTVTCNISRIVTFLHPKVSSLTPGIAPSDDPRRRLRDVWYNSVGCTDYGYLRWEEEREIVEVHRANTVRGIIKPTALWFHLGSPSRVFMTPSTSE